MGDPAGYLDEGKGLPWITMDSYQEIGHEQMTMTYDAHDAVVVHGNPWQSLFLI